MAGFFDNLMTMGAAHLKHVQALHQALQTADTQAAREQLGGYLRGLSDKALAGFRVSVGMLAGGEQNPQVRQALQWVLANVDGLRAGEFKPLTPQTLPRHGLSLAQASALIEPWFQLTLEQGQQQFHAALNALDAQGRAEFAAHLDTLALQAQQQLQQMQDNEANAWGSSFEDRMAYMQAKLSTGQRDPAQAQAFARQQDLVNALAQMAQIARNWVEEPVEAPAASAPAPTTPAAASTARPEVDMSSFPANGSPAEQMAFMRELLEHEKAGGRMDPARAAALADFVDNVTGYLRSDEQRQAGKPVDPADRAALEADLRDRMAHVAGLRERMDRFRDMHRDVRRTVEPAVGSRAATIGPRVDALIDDLAGLRNAQFTAARATEAQALEGLHMDLIRARARLDELAANDADVLHYEADTLRGTAQAQRLFHRRGHAMVARPYWPGGAARVEPGSALFGGPEALREVVAQACTARRLDLRAARQSGVDTATWLWRGVQRANVAVFDLSEADPQVYYQLGQAYALGTELLLTARAGTTIPFDVAQSILEYADNDELAAQLPAALDDVLYGVQTHGLSALMHGTLMRCRQIAEKAAGLEGAKVLLAQLEATVQAPLDFRGALEQFLGQLGNSRLVLLHPRWPAQYPAAGARRCFVVMPFSQTLASTQALYRRLDAELGAAGVEVVRGDEAVGQEIVASIWEETARASHVLVDLTGYNLNVCLELGMADTIGRDTLLIGAAGTPEARFAAIDKRRIHTYGEDDTAQESVRGQVAAFLKREPTTV
jgi:hypothetical protein